MKKALFLFAITVIVASAFSFITRVQEDPWKHVPDNFKGLKNPVTPDKASVEAGKVLYHSYCVSCHGEDGKGSGIRAPRLKGTPVDFTQSAFQEHSDGEILYVIYSGHQEMPGFKKKLLPGKAEVVTGTFGKTRNPGDLVNYVRGFGK